MVCDCSSGCLSTTCRDRQFGVECIQRQAWYGGHLHLLHWVLLRRWRNYQDKHLPEWNMVDPVTGSVFWSVIYLCGIPKMISMKNTAGGCNHQSVACSSYNSYTICSTSVNDTELQVLQSFVEYFFLSSRLRSSFQCHCIYLLFDFQL